MAEQEVENKLLERQIRKYLGEDCALGKGAGRFLQAVAATYDHYESDRTLLERSLGLSSEELTEAYRKLREYANRKALVVTKLREAVDSLQTLDGHIFLQKEESDEDIVAIADLLRAQIEQRKSAEERVQQSEANLLALIENTYDLIWSVDTEFRLLISNSAFRDYYERVHSVPIEEEAILEYPMETVSRRRWLEAYQRALKGERFIEEHVAQERGHVIYYEISFNPIVSFRAVTGVALFAKNVTERKLFERELIEAKEEAISANIAKSRFLANMTHELRTPLNAIIGYAEMLLEDGEELSIQECLEDLPKIQLAGRHLLHLVNDILDLSKIEAGHMELYLESFDVMELVKEVLSTLQPLIEHNSNQLEVIHKSEHLVIHADMTKVRQILFNLVSNASKFTSNGKIELLIKENAEEGTITFSVKDTGVGMTQEQMERIFAAFTQADSSTTRRYGGTGLGLAICKEFTEMMGGVLTLTSQIGEGSTFTLTLPIEVSGVLKAKQMDRQYVAVPPKEELLPSQTGPTVLIIDDDPVAHDLLRRLLLGEGYQIISSIDGNDGLEAARQFRPDVIILDILMPGRDGWSVLKELKSDPQLAGTPVIVLSIAGNPTIAFALGASEYISKPVQPSEIRMILQRYCGQKVASALLVESNHAMRQMLHRLLVKEGWQVHEASSGQAALTALYQGVPNVIVVEVGYTEAGGTFLLAELKKREAYRSIPCIAVASKPLDEKLRTILEGRVLGIAENRGQGAAEVIGQVQSLLQEIEVTKAQWNRSFDRI